MTQENLFNWTHKIAIAEKLDLRIDKYFKLHDRACKLYSKYDCLSWKARRLSELRLVFLSKAQDAIGIRAEMLDW